VPVLRLIRIIGIQQLKLLNKVFSFDLDLVNK
jgi:hypothetical protein